MNEPVQTSLIAGSKIEYSIDDGATFIEIEGVQELPEFREETGDREVTTINNTVRQYDNEIDSPSEQTITAYYVKNSADQLAFRTLARQRGKCIIKATYSDTESLQFNTNLRNYGINSGNAEATKMWSCVLRRTSTIAYTESAS